MRHALSGGLALAAATLAAVPAGAETFTVLIYESPAELRLRDAGGDAGAAYWHAYAAFGQSLAEAGVMRGGAALAVPAKPTEVTLGGYFTRPPPPRRQGAGRHPRRPRRRPQQRTDDGVGALTC
jgi:hypothetical protein